MRRVAVLAQGSLQIGCIWFALFSVLLDADAASAFSFEETIKRCRQTVGRPIVRDCMSGKSGDVRGVDFDACRARAAPRVHACIREAMILAFGYAKVERVIEHCRETLGRPIVKACMIDAQPGAKRATRIANLHACRAKASPQVRGCVRRTISTTH
jgi:hypothetical protein